MGRLLILFFAAIFTVLIFSCQSEVEETPTQIIITVQAKGDELPETELHLFNKITETTVDSSGFSKLTASVFGPAYYTLRSGRNSIQIYLIPGDSIHIELDWTDPSGTAKFSGDREVENQFLMDKVKIEQQVGWSNFVELYSSDVDDFYKKMNDGLLSLDSLMREIEKKDDVNNEFLMLERNYPEYKITYMGANYPNWHSRLTRTDIEDLDFPAEEARENLLKLENSNSDLLTLPIFRDVIKAQKSILWEEQIEDEEKSRSFEETLSMEFDLMRSTFENREILEYMEFSYLKDLIMFRGPGEIDELFENFMQTAQDEQYISILNSEMQNWENVMPGKEVPDFEFETPEGEIVTLSDLDGKLIYIDVWATWCGPCIREHPYWDELVEEYSDKEVHFLAISIDNSREPWEKMVAEKDMKGIHWFAENAWEADFVKHFNIRGIPRFILLDQERKVVRPSSERPSGQIRDLLDAKLNLS